MKTLVYMMRHGESMGNARHSFLGHTDLPLTEKGRAQARAACAYLARVGIVPDAAYASPLCRASETAKLALSYLPDLPILPSDDVKEIYAGKWENMLVSDIGEAYPDDLAIWRADIGNSRPTEGEAVRDLAERVRREVLRLAACHEGKTVFIACHATPIRTFEALARGLGMEGAHLVPWPANASLSAYLCEGESVTPLFYSLDSYLSLAENPTKIGL